MLEQLLCKINIHNWKETVEEEIGISLTPGDERKRKVHILKRHCRDCGKKQYSTIGRYSKWKDYK